LWDVAKNFDRQDDPGRVAKEFGLIDPNDPEKPTYTNDVFKLLEARSQTAAISPVAPKPSPFVDGFPVATLNDSTVKSGHAFVSESEYSKPKEKPKTRGTAISDTAEDGVEEGIDDDEEDSQSFPDVLPAQFKLGKRLMKVFIFIR